MNKGIIYLIQPAELVGTERYKIGMSNNTNLDRCKHGYKNGSRYICIMECNEPLKLERNIKNNFNKKFKLIAGNEYYEGNEKDILNTFNNLVIEHNNLFIINNFEYENLNKDEFDIDEIDIDEIDIDKIKKEFINYKDDIEFGGIQKLIKIYIIHENYERYDYIINFKFIYNKELGEENYYIHNINDYAYNYIKNIIDKKIIQNGNIYDLNNSCFQKKINKYKKIYNNVMFSEETKNKIIKNREELNILEKNTIEYLFEIDCLINDIPCCSYNEELFSFYPCNNENNRFKIYKLNRKYYDNLYLQKYIPYIIEFNKITKNYYLINCNYEYIGYNNIKSLTDIENNIDEFSRIYLIKYENKPWINQINFENYLKNYNQEKINNSLNILKNNNINFILFKL